MLTRCQTLCDEAKTTFSGLVSTTSGNSQLYRGMSVNHFRQEKAEMRYSVTVLQLKIGDLYVQKDSLI